MAWKIEISPTADKGIEKLDKPLQKEIKNYLYNHVANLPNPRAIGHALKGEYEDFWVYRFRKDYRIICDIQDEKITILVIEVGHRSDVYK